MITNRWTDEVLGEFEHAETGKWFYVHANNEAGRWIPTVFMPHRIATIDGPRYAKVLKSVAYVVVDEDAEGEPVIEKWKIKNCSFRTKKGAAC